jgi:hypothetical protein
MNGDCAQFRRHKVNTHAGYQKRVATARQSGEMSAKEGKDPCQFSGYRMLCQRALKIHSSFNSSLFVHPFTVFCWNLAARSVNVGWMMYSHISWEEDALLVTIPKTKNDPEGAVVYPKHVYANPYDPVICPMLSLGIKLLSTPYVVHSDEEDGDGEEANSGSCDINVFPGKNSETRYCQWLTKCICELTEEEKVELGVNPDEFGSHSFRKGVCTLCSSAPSGPSITSIFLRAGWSLGAVQQR